MKLGLATLAASVALVAAIPAHASTPIPWCGTTSSRVDRLPDATSAYAVHVIYVRPASAPDRFLEFAPRIVGDAAAFDAWWRSQDATRTPRFDLFPAPGCANSFGALDISNVQLTNGVSSIGSAFQEIRRVVAEIGFKEPEKAYLVYYDGPTGQVGLDHVCGQGARSGGFDLPGLAVVYLDSCDADQGDKLRPVVAMHELVHVFGAVERAAPNVCQSGHVCDFPLDLMTAVLTGEELEAHVLDSGRNDYYGHSGSWTDVQDSHFLERLDSPDRTPPAAPDGLRVGDDLTGFVRVSWEPSTDDLGPVAYRIYEDGQFVREVTTTTVRLADTHDLALFAIRAADGSAGSRPRRRALPVRGRHGRRAGPADPRHGPSTGDHPRHDQTDGEGRRAHWPAAHDAGGLRAYRVKIGPRTLTVQKPTITLARARVSGPVSIAAIDRAGNIGPSLVVARGRVH